MGARIVRICPRTVKGGGGPSDQIAVLLRPGVAIDVDIKVAEANQERLARPENGRGTPTASRGKGPAADLVHYGKVANDSGQKPC